MIYFVRICGVPRKSVDSFIGVTENARRCEWGPHKSRSHSSVPKPVW